MAPEVDDRGLPAQGAAADSSGRPSKLKFHPDSQHSQQAEQEVCRYAFEIAIQDCGHPRARGLRKPGQRGMSQANALELPADLLH